MIPDAAVEAAAKARYELGLGSWEGAHRDTREAEMEDMRAALEAAAPHMTKGAKADGWNEGYDIAQTEAFCEVDEETPNPYMPAP